jgi:hypothetical protein
MEPTFFKEMPKFKTPQEELEYLRAQVAKRENDLIDKGHFEHASDNALKDVVSAYRNIPVERALHSSNILEKQEKEKS